MKQYILLLKGREALDYSPELLQQRLEEYRAWVAEIGEHYISDQRLDRTGVHIKAKGELMTDGPFLESKEIIAGFVIIRAKDIEEASAISQTSPLLKYFEILVRPIVEQNHAS